MNNLINQFFFSILMKHIAKMPVKKAMRTRFPKLNVDDSIDDVFKIFKKHTVNTVPVFEGDKFVGEICLQDLMKLVIGASGFSASEICKDGMGIDTSFIAENALEIMRKHETTVDPDTTVAKVAKIMLDDDVDAVIVTDGNKVVGVISEEDIAKLMFK